MSGKSPAQAPTPPPPVAPAPPPVNEVPPNWLSKLLEQFGSGGGIPVQVVPPPPAPAATPARTREHSIYSLLSPPAPSAPTPTPKSHIPYSALLPEDAYDAEKNLLQLISVITGNLSNYWLLPTSSPERIPRERHAYGLLNHYVHAAITGPMNMILLTIKPERMTLEDTFAYVLTNPVARIHYGTLVKANITEDKMTNGIIYPRREARGLIEADRQNALDYFNKYPVH